MLGPLRRTSERVLWDLPTVMVMEEMPSRARPILLKRGAYDQPGEEVTPGVPAVLPPLAGNTRRNRLGFARWLVDPSNPLTARVAVNRFWQMYFGTGIVKTVDDFGSQGESPSHPELLDWLATEFVRTGWDVKALQKTDRDERHLPPVFEGDAGADAARSGEPPAGARTRVSGCPRNVRDQALSIAGCSSRSRWTSVKPYQPEGLWTS